MSDDVEKTENVELPKTVDRVSRAENLQTAEQNAQYLQALASNRDQFRSMQDLAIPGAASAESFQLVDGTKTIAASRQVEPAGANSFHEGLRALPENATDEQRVQYQIEYIARKSGDTGLLLKTGITQNELIEPNNEYDAIVKALDKYAQEQKERAIGALIGTVEGVGNVAMDIAWVADFGAALILGNKERAGEMGAQFGETVGSAMVSGVNLFKAANQYLYDVGMEGDYSKPFKDIASLGAALNYQWNELPPGQQERLKFKFVSELLADGLIGMPGAKVIQKAENYTELLELAAKNASRATNADRLKTANRIAKSIDELGASSIKLTEVPKEALRPEMYMPAVPEHLRKALQPCSDELLESIGKKDLLVVVAKEGSDDMKSLILAGAEGSYAADVILLRPGAPKIAALEEYLHALQDRFPRLSEMSIADREVHVKEFMLRNQRRLGLDENDVKALKILLEDAIETAAKQ